ncbi:MAG: glycerophosphodiester phosphodiesterase [Pseudomonadota bacterium]
MGAIIFCVALYGAFWWIAEPAKTHNYRSDRPLVYAHQGGNGQWPDNTLYAFERAAALGVDVLEMDVHGTADGEIVVLHDATVNRTTNGKGVIKEMFLEDIQALDAGHHWRSKPDSEEFPFRGQGIRIPTLAEVFLAFPNMQMNVEIKQTNPSIVPAVCNLIQQHRRADKTLVASFNTDTIESFREACPDVATGASWREVFGFYILHRAYLGNLYSPTASAIQIPEYSGRRRVITPEFVRAAHARNLAVVVWTVNKPDTMRRMVALGVDGIITDYPEQLLEILNTE